MQEFKAMRFSNSTKVYHSRNLLNFSEIKQIAPSSQISSYGLDRAQKVANSYHRHKIRLRGKQVVNSGNTKPPFGRSWFKSWQPALVISVPSCLVQTSADRRSFESLNPHSCTLLRIPFYPSYLTYCCNYSKF